MSFAMDRDLIALEPTLLRDIAFSAQRRLVGTCDVAGDTMTLTDTDHDLDASGVAPGFVAQIAGVSVEILAVLSPTSARISKIRADIDDPPIEPDAGAGLPVTIDSFAPQREMVHREVLRLAGIEPDDPSASPGKEQILFPRSLVPLEAYGALHLIYASASALAGDDAPVSARAAMYARLVARERARAKVVLDLDGDGRPDAVRRLHVLRLVRA